MRAFIEIKGKGALAVQNTKSIFIFYLAQLLLTEKHFLCLGCLPNHRHRIPWLFPEFSVTYFWLSLDSPSTSFLLFLMYLSSQNKKCFKFITIWILLLQCDVLKKNPPDFTEVSSKFPDISDLTDILLFHMKHFEKKSKWLKSQKSGSDC